MANKLCTDTELTTVANAIRSKGGTTAQLGFPDGMATAIGNLNVGTGLSPAASAGDILSGKKAVVNRQTITGSIASKAAATYYPSTNDQTISSGQYLSGTQTIKGVKFTVKSGGTGTSSADAIMVVGDSADEDRLGTIIAHATYMLGVLIVTITKQ